MSRLGRADDRQLVTIDDEAAADFARMGYAVAVDQVASADEEAFLVWKENWPSLLAFLGVETQWRSKVAGTALIWEGLDYVAVDVVLRRTKAPDHVFEDLKDMERAALTVFAEASNEQ